MPQDHEITRKFLFLRNSMLVIYTLTFLLSFLTVYYALIFFEDNKVNSLTLYGFGFLVCLSPVIYFFIMCCIFRKIEKKIHPDIQTTDVETTSSSE